MGRIMAVNPDIQKTQGYLRNLGYADVEIDGQKKNLAVDGIEGDITRAALKKFKSDHNLPEDAPLDATMAKMEAVIKENPQQTAQRVQATMAQGANAPRDDVSSMQVILNLVSKVFEALTGKPLKIDGINGPLTQQSYESARVNQVANAAVTTAPVNNNANNNTTITIPAASPQTEIHVAPGQNSPGITPPADGSIPMVVIDGAGGPQAAPSTQPAANTQDPVQSPAQVRLGERGTLTSYHRQEASRTGGADYNYERPQSAAELRREEMQQRREAQEAARDTNRAVRHMGALGDGRSGNDINAAAGLAEMAMRRLFSP